MSRKTTIIDVARAVGVSPCTVSHALSGKRAVGAKTKARIEQAIRELDYRPNYFAQSVRNRKTMLIAILTDQCRTPVTGQLLDCIESELSSRSYGILLGVGGLSVEKGRAMLRKMSSGMVDGIINMLPQISPEEAEELAGGLPVLTFLRDLRMPIQIDYRRATRDVLDYLFRLGHRKIGYIASRLRLPGAEDPAIGVFREFYAKHGLPFDPGLVIEDPPGVAGAITGQAAAPVLLERGATAVFCGNDSMALGVCRHCRKSGVRVPEELSVIGFDDSYIAEMMYPALTTVRLPLEEIANYTVQKFLERLDGKRDECAPLPVLPKMIIRESAGPAPLR